MRAGKSWRRRVNDAQGQHPLIFDFDEADCYGAPGAVRWQYWYFRYDHEGKRTRHVSRETYHNKTSATRAGREFCQHKTGR